MKAIASPIQALLLVMARDGYNARDSPKSRAGCTTGGPSSRATVLGTGR